MPGEGEVHSHFENTPLGANAREMDVLCWCAEHWSDGVRINML